MLTYDLNKCGDLSKYDFLYRCIRNDIISGKIKSNEKLPSKRMLAQHLSIGLITVANAYEQLLTEGYIRAEERVGYFVQDLSNSAKKTLKSTIEKKPELPEHEYFADFKANRVSLRLFPVATWNRMMRKSLCDNGDNLFKTVPYNGVYELREAIAEYLYTNRGMKAEPEQIIIGAGTEYLYGRLTQMFGRDSTFGFEDPGYKKLALISGAYGNECKFIPIDSSGLMVDALEESGTDIVHISPSNNFPTGIVMPITRRMELLEWVNKKENRYIIEDDYDSEFRYKGKYIPPLYTDDLNGKVIYINTFSKTMVPSLRISYMVLPKSLLMKYTDTMSFYSCTVSSFEQYALAEFISGGYFERHINRIKNYYKKLRIQIIEAINNSRLREMSEIIEHNSGTHFLLYVDTDMSPEEIKKKSLSDDIHLQMYSDYVHSENKNVRKVLVINYAGIEPEKINDVVKRLESIFVKN